MAKRKDSHTKVESSKAAEGSRQKSLEKKPAAAPAAKGLLPDSEVFPAKKRCAGATRSGDQCRYWSTATSDFCYWCQQASAPRWPLPKPEGTIAELANKHEIHKRRCAGVTVYGDACRFFAVGNSDYCSWCDPASKPKPPAKKTI